MQYIHVPYMLFKQIATIFLNSIYGICCTRAYFLKYYSWQLVIGVVIKGFNAYMHNHADIVAELLVAKIVASK